MKNKPELLSPAGDFDRLKIALDYGADAVYAGVPEFGMRKREIGFNLDSLEQGIKYAHDLGKKVYVTVNIFANNNDIRKLPQFLKKLRKIDCDALIVADVGVLQLIIENEIGLPIHLSTQANITNWQAVKWWINHDIDRVVLARELSELQVKEIHKKVPNAELEIFVHGSLCMSYSGRCNISRYLTNRDANHGDCSHCCRWNYDFYVSEKNRPGKFMKIEEDDRGSYFFYSKDLCLIESLDKVVDAGVVSLKIEGRNKSMYYVAAVTLAYRQALDLLFNDKKKYLKNKKKFSNMVSAISNRGYTTGFFGGDIENMNQYEPDKVLLNREYVGLIKRKIGDYLEVEAKNQIKATDQLDILSINKIDKLENVEFYDVHKSNIGKVVNTNTIFYIKYENELDSISFLRKVVEK